MGAGSPMGASARSCKKLAISLNIQTNIAYFVKIGFWWGRIGLDLRLNFTIRHETFPHKEKD